ncbi:MAG TPA: hypothetical protein VNB29_02925 [Chthoniobacterales bacterium]|nr:hypothetical protein [Chthoniobacterales bacterium]
MKTNVALGWRGLILRAPMFSEDDFQYALENTRVIRPPEQAIQTFGTTSFRFMLVTELMDHIDRVRVRDGKIHAERPSIIAPQHYSKLMLEGFGEDARGFADWLETNGRNMQFLRYGFQFRKTDISEEIVHAPKADVVGRLGEMLDSRNEPMSTIIEGVEDGWEVCLLKFTVDLVQRSAGENVNEWKRRGLL